MSATPPVFPEPVVEVAGLVKDFGGLRVLHGIDFEVARGEVVAVIGPSGGGKSTLLRCVTHLEAVTGGTIRIGGKTLVRDGVYADRHTLREAYLHMGWCSRISTCSRTSPSCAT